MLLSTQTSRLQNKFGYEAAIRILAGSGFDAFDLSLFRPVDDNDKLYKRNFRAYAKSLRDLADSLGIRCNQSHAPFPSSVGDPEKDAEIFKSIVHAMEIASILGADHIVVHPKQHMPYRENAAKLKEINMRFYKDLVPYCKKFSIKVALENMWQMNPIGGKTIVDSTCSRVEEFCDYLDTLDSPYFGACLDTRSRKTAESASRTRYGRLQRSAHASLHRRKRLRHDNASAFGDRLRGRSHV